jgi:hypothetical protein
MVARVWLLARRRYALGFVNGSLGNGRWPRRRAARLFLFDPARFSIVFGFSEFLKGLLIAFEIEGITSDTWRFAETPTKCGPKNSLFCSRGPRPISALLLEQTGHLRSIPQVARGFLLSGELGPNLGHVLGGRVGHLLRQTDALPCPFVMFFGAEL